MFCGAKELCGALRRRTFYRTRHDRIDHRQKRSTIYFDRSTVNALGAVGFLAYAIVVSCALARYKPIATISLMPVWAVTSFGLWYWVLR
jgi:predicted ATPase